MKILAVDTSSRNCSVSIVEVDKNKNINVIAQKAIEIIEDIATAFPTPFAASAFFFSPPEKPTFRSRSA